MISADFLFGLAIGLAISGATFLGAWAYFRRSRERRSRLPPTPGSVVGIADLAPVASPPPAVSGGEAAHRPSAAPDVILPTPPAPPLPVGDRPVTLSEYQPTEPPSEGSNGFRKPPEALVLLSHRVVLHLYRQGVLGPSEVAPRSLSQSGMSETLAVRQGALAGVLRRLEASGVVVSATAHVRGGSRRVKVYRLTDRGSRLALELRGGRAGGPAPPNPARRRGG